MITVNSVPVSKEVARTFLEHGSDFKNYMFANYKVTDSWGLSFSFSSEDEEFGVFLRYRGFKIRLFHVEADGTFNERISPAYLPLRSTLYNVVDSWLGILGALIRFDLDMFFLSLLDRGVLTPYVFTIPRVGSSSFTLILGQPDRFMFTYRFDKKYGRGSFSCSGDARSVEFGRLPKGLTVAYDTETGVDGSVYFTAKGKFDSVEKRNEVILGILSAYGLVKGLENSSSEEVEVVSDSDVAEVGVLSQVEQLLKRFEVELNWEYTMTIAELARILYGDYISITQLEGGLLNRCSSLSLRYLVVWSKQFPFECSNKDKFTEALRKELETVVLLKW